MPDTHPLWRPYVVPSAAEIAAARLRPPERAAVTVVAPDPQWSSAYAALRARLIEALGDRVLEVTHVGSTAVPGLWAKPVIDVNLLVPDSADEASYVPDLERAGVVLRVREPADEEHRVLSSEDPAGNVHVWSPGAVEPRRTRAFRDWLRTHPEDLPAYADLKRSLAAQGFLDVMDYNNAKGGLIYDLYERIFAADPEHPHDPRPRV